MPSYETQAILFFEEAVDHANRSCFAVALFWYDSDMIHRVEAIVKQIFPGQSVGKTRLEKLFNPQLDLGHNRTGKGKLEVSINDATQLSVWLGLGARLPWEPTLNTVSVAINGLSLTRKDSEWRPLVVDDFDAEASPQPSKTLSRRAASLLSKLDPTQFRRKHYGKC
jgi:hypothetical protein